MKELIQNLIEGYRLESEEFMYNDSTFILAHYPELQKSDFFLFQFGKVSMFRQKVDGNLKKFEYELNSMIGTLRSDKLLEYKSRYIEKNLSLIIVAENDEGTEDINWMLKSEENYYQSRKYILTYSQGELEVLNDKIKEIDKTLVLSLTELVSLNSDKLKNFSDEPWFNLLTRIFTKIPFLNYHVTDGEKRVLEDIDKSIFSKLDELNLIGVYNSILEHDMGADINDLVELITKED
ncbi:ABC-three component system middle component 1 [Leeuwenhoekiella polynyae]|uniref:Uncharacterized protein n=1 Tax=Leeuwenhoekiella polynyae TaxID=1550906 RepID=A0A4V1KQC1_9FLAO|nr:ABC-three component system middle component 1 [Leeuwenhoekiella polynyae]RXG20892.1 hypothetical protein DSM02_2263 [Leeuwenhoekiella polynyae]